ncbi:uncharacterized protein LOC115681133 isoform X2 [Syzygium oleosum]|uniref:uncharacterized protein LOC115681133 isoform X2 n=1 Tax=Syzygium oleosum TaxID=219896 RepID=UPI0024B91FF9|nr:uncharacterized protein LOC115681133 isoform X2 [Syzygium oleosum]
MGSPGDVLRPLGEPYVRSRENPFFNGLLRGDTKSIGMDSAFDFPVNGSGRGISRSASDIGDIRGRNFVLDASKHVTDFPAEDSFSDVLEPFALPSSGLKSKAGRSTSFSFQSVQSESSVGLDDQNSSPDSNFSSNEERESFHVLDFSQRSFAERKSYTVNTGKSSLLRIPLPQSAASFYNGVSPLMEIVESCQGIKRLNLYLKERRDDVSAGVPGRFLHVVIGQDGSDVGSLAAAIMYAFYLNETLGDDQICTVPVINMRRADFGSHVDLKWLLNSCQIDEASLVFIDEIDLSYYDLFGSLRLVLVNGHKIPPKQEALKEAVVEIFSCRKGESVYPWVRNVTFAQDCSTCTLLVEKFALTFPQILAGQGVSRLLLSGILLDTANLSLPHCTSKDKYMATLLIYGAGRFGCDGLYQILRYKMYDVSDLKVTEILRKDFKKWTRIGNPDTAGLRFSVSHVGMSSIGMPVGQLLDHEDSSTQEIKLFQQLEKLRVLTIVSGYYDVDKNFKREILVSAESVELKKNILHFFNSNASQLPLKVLPLPGLRNEMSAFEIDKFTSRKNVERLLEEFGNTLKG